MAGKYAIETVFKLIDSVTRPLDRIGAKSKSISNALKHDFEKATKSVDALGKKITDFGKGAMIGAGAAVGAGLGIATAQFLDFDSTVTAAAAKFKDVDLTTPEGYQGYLSTLDAIGKKAREVAAVTEYNAVDTAGALDKMAMSGLTSNQSMSLLMGTTNLATATGLDLTSAVDMATDALGAFGLMSDDTTKLSGNLDRLSDVFAKTTNMFNTDLPMMFEAVKQGAPTFTSTGQSLEDFSAMIGVMANQGKKGGEAGTVLRNMMGLLAKPAKPAAEALEALGIKTRDAGGNFLNVIDILEQFEKAFQGMGNATKQGYLKDIFGQENITGITMMLSEGTKSIRAYSDQLKNAGGTAEMIANAMRGSIKNKIAVLGSALTELGFKFVEAFQEKGVDALEKLIDVVSNFDPTPLVEFAKQGIDALWKLGEYIVSTVKYLWGFRDIAGAVIKVLWDFRGAIATVIGIVGFYKTFLMAAAFASKTFAFFQGIAGAATFVFTLFTKGSTAALDLLKKGTLSYAIAQKTFAFFQNISSAATAVLTYTIKKETAALEKLKAGTIAYAMAQKGIAIANGIATAAQWAFNIAAAANPIGLIVIAVVAAVAIIVGVILLIRKHWDKLTEAVKTHVNKILFVLTLLTGPLGFIISMIVEIVSNWKNISKALEATGLFEKIKAIGTSIKQFVSGAIDWIASKVQWLGSAIVSFIQSATQKFAAAWDWVKNTVIGIVQQIGSAIIAFIQPAIDWLIGIWDKVKLAVAGFFSYVVTGIQAFFQPAIMWIVNAWQSATATISNFFKGIFTAIATFVRPILDWFAERWQDIVEFFQDSAIVNAIKVIGGTLISGLLRPVQGFLEILSHIPGVGNLAGKGAEKIQEIRNALTGKTDTAAIKKKRESKESLFPEISKEDGMKSFALPDFAASGMPNTDFDITPLNMNSAADQKIKAGKKITGAGGSDELEEKSKLHGVYDINGGLPSSRGTGGASKTSEGGSKTSSASLNQSMVNLLTSIDRSVTGIFQRISGGTTELALTPVFPGQNIPAMPQTVNTASINPALPDMSGPIITAPKTSTLTESSSPNILTQNVIDIASVIKRIETSIGNFVPSISLPAIKQEDSRDNPKNTSPVTQADRVAYSLQERRETIAIEVSAAKGSEARIVSAPRDIDIKVVQSGGNG
jgi:TP901 family phage tail tape measure protein